EGSTFTFNGRLMRISYVGGDGNDVVLSTFTHAVTPNAGPNGTISPDMPQPIVPGERATFTVTPDIGYAAVVGGTCGGMLVGNTYTTDPVTGPCTVDATFTQVTYTVTPTVGSNGTMSP